MWANTLSNLKVAGTSKFQDWLLHSYNLGGTLRTVCNNLTLNIIEQDFDFPLDDELDILGLREKPSRERLCFVRKIFLEGDGIPLSYGRVVIPESVYRLYWETFNALGTKLIGETLLYGNEKTRRSAFEYTVLDGEHSLFHLIADALPLEAKIPSMWFARRSLFYLNGKDPLLVTDVLMEDIPAFPFSEVKL